MPRITPPLSLASRFAAMAALLGAERGLKLGDGGCSGLGTQFDTTIWYQSVIIFLASSIFSSSCFYFEFCCCVVDSVGKFSRVLM